jgi:hypothetical protein
MPSATEDEEYLHTDTLAYNLVYEYSGLTFAEQMQLGCITLKMLVRDAYIHKMSQTEEGRDYLQQCWILTQTKPDKAKLREKFQKGK